MDFLDELAQQVDAVSAFAAVSVAEAAQQSDQEILRLLELGSALVRSGERLRTVAAGVAAARSRREAGHGGLAQSRGHRTAVALVQEMSGSSRADAARQVRVGQSLLEGMAAGAPPQGERPDGASPAPDGSSPAPDAPRAAPWHAPVDTALLGERVTTTQADAILRGLGEPPCEPGHDAAPTDAVEAWRLACEQLVHEAGTLVVEELAAAARQIRDRLDPQGAEARYLARHEQRSFRMWTDAEGVHHARIRFDDHGAAWVRAMIDSALRPRRGGPRFVDSAEAARAAERADDPRTDEQLGYDLLLDVLHAGAVADAAAVFGTRQPGVRVLTVKDDPPAGARPARVGHLEDGGDALPPAAVAQLVCDVGTVPVGVDPSGNPLDVGREQRLFTPRQRIALAVRDGGCRWPGCTMRAAYCEAHHIDEWAAHSGRTDVDRGILLCRYHHMNLHHRGYRIRREGRGPFLLHPASGPPTELPSRSLLRWEWRPPAITTGTAYGEPRGTP